MCAHSTASRRQLHAADINTEHRHRPADGAANTPRPGAATEPLAACARTWEQPCPAGLAAARADVRAALSRWWLAPAADLVVLAASELLANAFEHGAPPVELRLSLQTRSVRRVLLCEVRDNAPEMPVLASPVGAAAERGRGLAVVTALADTFGIRPHGRGKTVWFTVTVPSARQIGGGQ